MQLVEQPHVQVIDMQQDGGRGQAESSHVYMQQDGGRGQAESSHFYMQQDGGRGQAEGSYVEKMSTSPI